MEKLYFAKLTRVEIGGSYEWKGMCKHYVEDGKQRLTFRFIRPYDTIVEILAEPKEAPTSHMMRTYSPHKRSIMIEQEKTKPGEKVEGYYHCYMLVRKLDTECDPADFFDEDNENVSYQEIKMEQKFFGDRNIGAFICVGEIGEMKLIVDTSVDFSDFCQNSWSSKL